MAGREIVYTVHKFEAENIDEISINVGEQVIVLEKDEGYNDGWWQGRNMKGETGLFPISYTVKKPPVTLLDKIDSVETSISKMKPAMQKSVHQSLVENKRPVEDWTSEQVAAWLIHAGFDKELADNFKEQEISGDILLELTLDSLKELQVTTFGKRFKIHSAINVLRQESKKQQFVEARVQSPIPENPISVIYNSNKQQHAYIDDDLVSDYSTVIRNSKLPANAKKLARPSIPLDMDLIASSRLSTLVERQGSISSTHTNRPVRPSQQQINNSQPMSLQQHQLNQQQLQQQRQKIQQAPQRPSSHQHLPPPTMTTSSEWKRNTMNNMKSQEMEEPRPSTSSRYSFMRTSLLPNNKLQSVIPTNMVRRSEDIVSLAEVSVSPDMEGWLYKQGDKYKTWNKRWFVLKSNNLFYFKSPKAVRMKGIINLKGYRIEVDETIHPGKYCFKAYHGKERTFFFFTEHEKAMKDWLKALMKATIARDFGTPVMSSSTIPTISLEMARKMRPRPPSTLFNLKDPNRLPTPTNYRIQNNLDQQFSNMALFEEPPSRAPSSMSTRQRDIGLKDSGFNSSHGANLSRSITESSGSSSTRKSQNTSSIASPGSVIFYPDEEDEDLIDPEHMSVIEVNRYQGNHLYPHDEEQEIDPSTVFKKQQRYLDWINSNVQKSRQVQRITDLCTGETLLALLETLSGKEIMRPITNPSESTNVQSMDRIIAAFKFMTVEGVEFDGACTVRDILNGNGDKTIYMLDSIKYWSQNKPYEVVNGKKMASGGTFGEDDQSKLRELEDVDHLLHPHSFTTR